MTNPKCRGWLQSLLAIALLSAPLLADTKTKKPTGAVAVTPRTPVKGVVVAPPVAKPRPPVLTTKPIVTVPLKPELEGWIDLHAHPMTNLGFGGKLIHGGPDVGSLLPADAGCNHNVRARSMAQALGEDNSTHGGWGLDNGCGDDIRKAVIDNLQSSKHAAVTPDRARGAADFSTWPKWDDITHQKMWIDWVRRAHWGGQRVMVALATHNQTLAAALSGPGDGPTDDKASGDLQIGEMKALVDRHRDFMEVALTAADLRRIVSAGKLAVVLGVELDAIGNFHGKNPAPTNAAVAAEISRLYDKGVRYIFPIHVIDNRFGGTAAYEGAFNTSNYREFGDFWRLGCSPTGDRINFRYSPDGFDAAVAVVKATKLGIDIARNPPTPPNCPAGSGHVNSRGLTTLGQFALKEMMKRGMLIDIDHMSQLAANRALSIAEAVPSGGYPLNSGHNEPRGSGGSENSRTPDQVARIAALKGVFGMGIEDLGPDGFIRNYRTVLPQMNNRGIGFGTDINGLVKGARPRTGTVRYDSSFPKSSLGSKQWDYNTEGVAHYGMLADFIKALQGRTNGTEVVNSLNRSAEFFAQMWEQAERQRGKVR